MSEQYEVIGFPDAIDEEHRKQLHKQYPFVCRYWPDERLSALNVAVQQGYLSSERDRIDCGAIENDGKYDKLTIDKFVNAYNNRTVMASNINDFIDMRDVARLCAQDGIEQLRRQRKG